MGAIREDSNATGVDGNDSDNSLLDSGAVYVFRRTGTAWSQEAYLKASNTEQFDLFGIHLALSGDALAVGAPNESSSAAGPNGDEANNDAPGSGAVYVFRRTGGAWSQEAYLKASNPGSGDNFGTSVAIDGDTLVVGAEDEGSDATGIGGDQTSESASRSGAVYVFRNVGSEWSQEAYLKASNTEAEDIFGASLALFNNTLAVGARFEASGATGVDGDQTDNTTPKSGAVYLFHRVGTTWAQNAYIKASNTAATDIFGVSIAISGDILAVGASLEDSDANGVDGDQTDTGATDSGAVYIYH